MQRLLSRVDGVQAPIEPVVLLDPATDTKPGAKRRAREARQRAIRKTRETAVVMTGRAPRALEALLAGETSDLHDELLASGLL
jgi:hypothetical protein